MGRGQGADFTTSGSGIPDGNFSLLFDDFSLLNRFAMMDFDARIGTHPD